MDDEHVGLVHAGVALEPLAQIQHPVDAIGDDRQCESHLQRDQPEAGLVVNRDLKIGPSSMMFSSTPSLLRLEVHRRLDATDPPGGIEPGDQAGHQ